MRTCPWNSRCAFHDTSRSVQRGTGIENIRKSACHITVLTFQYLDSPHQQGVMFCKTHREHTTEGPGLHRSPQGALAPPSRSQTLAHRSNSSSGHVSRCLADVDTASGLTRPRSAHYLEKRMMPSCLGSQDVPDAEMYSRNCRFGCWWG